MFYPHYNRVPNEPFNLLNGVDFSSRVTIVAIGSNLHGIGSIPTPFSTFSFREGVETFTARRTDLMVGQSVELLREVLE